MEQTGARTQRVLRSESRYLFGTDWVLWVTIHLFYLIGYRNGLLALINWARHYLFREHAACRILPSESRSAAERRAS